MKRVCSGFALFAFLLVGCGSNKNLAPQDYVAYMQDGVHHFKQEVVTHDLTYTVQLATPEYMVCQEMYRHAANVKAAEVNKRLNDLKNTLFFLVHISSKKPSSAVETMQNNSRAEVMNMYYEASASNDIMLYNGNMQQHPSIYHFENNYGLVPYNTIVVGFDVADKALDMRLVFNDRYNEEPMIQTAFSGEILSKLPTLQIK